MIGRMGKIVCVLGRWWLRNFLWVEKNRRDEEASARELRRAFEELGSVFIKFGQLLAMRPDLIPRAYCRELFYLLDTVPSFAFAQVEQIIRGDLHRSVKKLFRAFDPVPAAAASFGQVHRAVTMAGDRVAVKIQRPGMRVLVARDITLMRVLARLIDAFTRWPNTLLALVKEFESWTQEELDYRTEAAYTQKFHERVKEGSGIYVPRVYENLCSARVLAVEYIEGIPLSRILRSMRGEGGQDDLATVRAWGFSPQETALRLVKHHTRQIYLDGFFHADPHPANVIFTPDQNLVYVDFGIVGELSRVERFKCLRYTRSVLHGDDEEAFRVLGELCDTGGVKDMQRFKDEHARIVSGSLRKLREEGARGALTSLVGGIIRESLDLLQRHGAVLKISIIRYFRTMLTIDSLILELDPRMAIEDLAARFRDVSFMNLVQELPEFIKKETYEREMLKLLNILEKEVMDAN